MAKNGANDRKLDFDDFRVVVSRKDYLCVKFRILFLRRAESEKSKQEFQYRAQRDFKIIKTFIEKALKVLPPPTLGTGYGSTSYYTDYMYYEPTKTEYYLAGEVKGNRQHTARTLIELRKWAQMCQIEMDDHPQFVKKDSAWNGNGKHTKHDRSKGYWYHGKWHTYSTQSTFDSASDNDYSATSGGTRAYRDSRDDFHDHWGSNSSKHRGLTTTYSTYYPKKEVVEEDDFCPCEVVED